VCEGGEGSALCERGRGERNNRKVEYLTYWGKYKKYFCTKMMFLEICVGCVFDVCVSIVMGDFIHNRTRLYNAWKGMIKYVCILVLLCE
jgi:hypothetical protein